MNSKEFWYWLCNRKGIGIRKINALLERFEQPENVFNADMKELKRLKILLESDICEILNNKSISTIQEDYAKLAKKGIRFVTKEDDDYPKKLKNIFDAPICLYIRGELPENNKLTIAIVGARNCSNYGKEMAYHFAKQLSLAGVQIVSGLAVGVDGYAHQGALKSKNPTYGVMGCGIDICYPASNIELYMQMQNMGGIISEYGVGIPAKPGNFPMRNRIISGLSDGVLVVEAKGKSGSLITVDMALEQGRDVFAIPGRICDGLSEGCNNLIKMGAEIANRPEDILDNYHIIYKQKNKDDNNILNSKEKLVFSKLNLEPMHINQIVEQTNTGLIEVIEILAGLEENNRIKQTTKNCYAVVM